MNPFKKILGWFSTSRSSSSATHEEGNATPAGAKSIRLGVSGRKRFPARAPRVQILPMHEVLFDRKSPDPAAAFRIANLSTSGFALARGGEGSGGAGALVLGAEPAVGSRWAGLLCSKRQGDVPVQAEVVHVATLVVGFKFIDPSAALAEWVRGQFQLELGALALTEIAREILKDEPDGLEPTCYTGAGGAELFFVAEPGGGKITRFEMTFLGNVFAGGAEGKAVQYGQMVEGGRDDQVRLRSSDAIRWEPRMPAEMMDMAVRFVNNIETLSSFRKLELTRLLSRIPREIE